jgi:hypothetical protein
VGEHHRVQADLLAIDLDGLFANDAFLAQALHAAPDRGLRQPDPLADRRRIDAGLRLQ